MGNILGRHLRDVGVSEAEAAQFAERAPECFKRVGVGHVIEDTCGRETDPHTIASPDTRNGFRHFQSEADAVLHRPAVLITTLVCCRP